MLATCSFFRVCSVRYLIALWQAQPEVMTCGHSSPAPLSSAEASLIDDETLTISLIRQSGIILPRLSRRAHVPRYHEWKLGGVVFSFCKLLSSHSFTSRSRSKCGKASHAWLYSRTGQSIISFVETTAVQNVFETCFREVFGALHFPFYNST